MRIKKGVEMNASTVESVVKMLYYKLLSINIPKKLSPGDPIAR
jgi:hypothetical protein